jgi:hypothetical protein
MYGEIKKLVSNESEGAAFEHKTPDQTDRQRKRAKRLADCLRKYGVDTVTSREEKRFLVKLRKPGALVLEIMTTTSKARRTRSVKRLRQASERAR